MIFINNARIARKEITEYIQGITDDNTVIVGRIIPIVENSEVIIDMYLQRRIDENILSHEKLFKVFLENTKSITGTVAINSSSVIEKIKNCINKDQIIKAVVELYP